MFRVAVVVRRRKISTLRMKHKFFWTAFITFKITAVNITWLDKNGSAKPTLSDFQIRRSFQKNRI